MAGLMQVNDALPSAPTVVYVRRSTRSIPLKQVHFINSYLGFCSRGLPTYMYIISSIHTKVVQPPFICVFIFVSQSSYNF